MPPYVRAVVIWELGERNIETLLLRPRLHMLVVPVAAAVVVPL